eukprot:13731094-Alexandrium_andersonii.AAC.1
MSASLVGSEMCIRDRGRPYARRRRLPHQLVQSYAREPQGKSLRIAAECCLLYTSDAADDM